MWLQQRLTDLVSYGDDGRDVPPPLLQAGLQPRVGVILHCVLLIGRHTQTVLDKTFNSEYS